MSCFFAGRYGFTSDGLSRFYARRAARILPLFWLASAVAIIGGIWASIEFQPTVANLVAGLLMLQWTHVTYPVGVFWTLGVELHFYILAPLLCLALIRSRQLWWLAGGLTLLTLLILFGGRADDRSMPANLHFFVAGMLMARIATNGVADRLLSKRWALPLTVGAGIAAIAAAGMVYTDRFWDYRGAILTVVAIVSFLAAHRALEMRRIAPNMIGRAFMVLGVLAYGLYAWHGVVLTLWPWFGNQLTATFLVSIALAWLSYALIERPVMHGGKRFFSPHPKRAAA